VGPFSQPIAPGSFPNFIFSNKIYLYFLLGKPLINRRDGFFEQFRERQPNWQKCGRSDQLSSQIQNRGLYCFFQIFKNCLVPRFANIGEKEECVSLPTMYHYLVNLFLLNRF